MQFINQTPQDDLSEHGGCVVQRDRDGAGHGRQPQRARVGREVDVWDEEPQAFEDVAGLQDPERRGAEEAEIETAAAAGGVGERDARFDVVQQGGGENDEGERPCAQHNRRTVFAQAPVHDERDGDARDAGAGPHDAIGEAFALDEPLVEETGQWSRSQYFALGRCQS